MPAKALMVLGTGSGVGKSVVAAGLCRIFSDWGYRVAPFKAQNMSNNSWVTDEGGEIGRAQAVQAECARVKPHTDMNPVLLKPSADNHSQVVLQGRAIGHFSARDYYGQKEILARAIQDSYERLSAQHEIMVIEGAGSPAEINLKKNDLVNMRMAEAANASCVLVGDIDRGGVFASLIGTLDLLSPEERDRFFGLIINRFRGDVTLLQEGFEFLEKRTGKKVLGTIPYLRELGIDEEDAAVMEEKKLQQAPGCSEDLDIAVVMFPRMSNFTDFEVLNLEPGVRLRYLKHPSELGCPDLLILPGTKATIADLNFLKQIGFWQKITDFANHGGRILGICGGYQMMGKRILDPQKIESDKNEISGFGFFDTVTVFSPEKVLQQVLKPLQISLFGRQVEGAVEAYEIHMGKTLHHEAYESFGDHGAIHPSGRWAGTYYHGLFDNAEFRNSFLNALAESAGKKRPGMISSSAKESKEIYYRRWAAHLTEHLDMNFITERLGPPAFVENMGAK